MNKLNAIFIPKKTVKQLMLGIMILTKTKMSDIYFKLYFVPASWLLNSF